MLKVLNIGILFLWNVRKLWNFSLVVVWVWNSLAVRGFLLSGRVPFSWSFSMHLLSMTKTKILNQSERSCCCCCCFLPLSQLPHFRDVALLPPSFSSSSSSTSPSSLVLSLLSPLSSPPHQPFPLSPPPPSSSSQIYFFMVLGLMH